MKDELIRSIVRPFIAAFLIVIWGGAYSYIRSWEKKRYAGR